MVVASPNLSVSYYGSISPTATTLFPEHKKNKKITKAVAATTTKNTTAAAGDAATTEQSVEHRSSDHFLNYNYTFATDQRKQQQQQPSQRDDSAAVTVAASTTTITMAPTPAASSELTSPLLLLSTMTRNTETNNDTAAAATNTARSGTDPERLLLLLQFGSDTDPTNNDDGTPRSSPSDPAATPPPCTAIVGVVFGAVANLCSATLGAGVLALPFALRQAGLVVGGALLVGAAAATVASVHILVRASVYYKCDTYERLAQIAVAPSVRTAVEACLLIFCAGCAVAYVIAVGDILQQAGLLLGCSTGCSRTPTLLLVYATAMLPLSLLRRVQSLQCASCFSISAIMILVVAVFMHWMEHFHLTTPTPDENATEMLFEAQNSFDWHWSLDNQNETNAQDNDNDTDATTTVRLADFLWPAGGIVSVLTACPIVLFAFSCQANVCSIFQELTVPSSSPSQRMPGSTTQRDDDEAAEKSKLMGIVTLLAVGICATLYGCVSLITLADFGSHVQANMLSCYVDAGPMMQAATAAMAVAVILAFPLNIFPARVTLLGMIAKYRYRHGEPTIFLSMAAARSNPAAASSTLDRRVLVPNEGLTAALLDDEEMDQESREPNLQLQNIAHDPLNEQEYLAVEQLFSADTNHILHFSLEGRPVHTGTISIARGNNASSLSDSDYYEDEDDVFDLRLHVLTTLFLTGLVLGLALILPNISVVFGLLGGTASSVLGFCVPGLIGLRMVEDTERRQQQQSSEDRPWKLKLVSWLLLSGGVAVGCLTTGVTVYSVLLRPNYR